MPSVLKNTGSSISFGFQDVNKSMYITEAKGAQIPGQSPQGGYTDFKTLSLAKEEREAIKRDLTATHYSVGNLEEISPQYETSNKMKDFTKTPLERAALNNEQMDDLRAVHYRLGNYPTNYVTTAKSSFVKPVGASRGTLSKAVRDDLRAHHFNVKSGIGGGYTSESAARYTFDPSKIKISPEEKLKKQELKNELRACHYKIGRASNGSYSTTGSQPDPRNVPNFNPKVDMSNLDLRKTNWSTGTDTLEYVSTYGDSNLNKPAGKSLLKTLDIWEDRQNNPQVYAAETKRDLQQLKAMKSMIKKSNLYMGRDNFSNSNTKSIESETKSQFSNSGKSHPKDAKVVTQTLGDRIKENRMTHYDLGTDVLDYKKTLVSIDPREVGYVRPKLSAETKAQLKNTHFRLGFDKQDICSITSSDFKTKPIQRNKLDDELKADLRATHFELGTDRNIAMTSTYAGTHKLDSTYKNPALFPEEKAKMVKLKQELKGTHYELGRIETDYYRSMRMPKHLDVKREKVEVPDLRSTNWSMGEDILDYTTETGILGA